MIAAGFGGVKLGHGGTRWSVGIAGHDGQWEGFGLAPYDGQHRVAATLHVLPRVGLEVQPQQRLGVGRPDVEVPVVVVHRDPVELRYARVPVARLDARQGRRRVVDLRVYLSRDVIPLTQRGQDLAEPAAL